MLTDTTNYVTVGNLPHGESPGGAGSVWMEREYGTMVVGTCLHDLRPDFDLPRSAFLRGGRGFSCATFTLFDPDGTAMGYARLSIREMFLQMECPHAPIGME